MHLSFAEFVQRVIREAEPLSQNTDRSTNNLGFGWIYYAVARNLAPDVAVAIGSAKGFMPFCLARGLQDNGRGRVVFIDPSYEGLGPPGWSGVGHWGDPELVKRWVERFGLGEQFVHLKMTSAEALPGVRRLTEGQAVGLVVIDGAHSYEQSLMDFEMYAPLIRDGLVLFHDSINPVCGVQRCVEELRGRGHHAVTLHREAGLTLVEVKARETANARWGYMAERSNRGELLFELVRGRLEPGDVVLDMYCGCSPLAEFLGGHRVHGFDGDPQAVERLRSLYPGHHWQAVDERSLLLAPLPDRVDVLLGLGLSRGHSPWDPRFAVANARFLLGYYRPRVCMFEASADYFNADILADLGPVVRGAGYEYDLVEITTNMKSHPRRKALVARPRV